MHPLRKYIIDQLRFEQPLSYSQMHPKDIESSLFQYHLRALLGEGLIRKIDRGLYELTDKAYAKMEYMSIDRHDEVRMPKVISFTLLTHDGVMLLYKKPKEPYRHLFEPVGGKIHFGERADVAAQRDVKEKANVSIPLPSFCGVANVMVSTDDAILTHMIVYLFTAEVDDIAGMSDHMMQVTSLDNRNDLTPFARPLITAIREQKTPFVINLNLEYKKENER